MQDFTEQEIAGFLAELAQYNEGVRYDFTFALTGLSNCHCYIQNDNTRLVFDDPQGLTHTLKLRGFPQKSPDKIDVFFDRTIQKPDGSFYFLTKPQREIHYEEFFQALFLFYRHPMGTGVFGWQQAINGLTRRIAEFEGHFTLQTGHRLFDFQGNFVQPITFTVSNLQAETGTDEGGNITRNNDGGLTLTIVDGDGGPYTYKIDDGEPPGGFEPWPQNGIVTGLSAGVHQVSVQSIGNSYVHTKEVTIPENITPA